MNRWLTSLIVCVLYAAVAVIGNVAHDHRGEVAAAPSEHCAACAWYVTGATDVPVVSSAIIFTLTQVSLRANDEVFPSAIFYSETPSRAPPAA